MSFFSRHNHKVKQFSKGKRDKYPRYPKRAKWMSFRRWLYKPFNFSPCSDTCR